MDRPLIISGAGHTALLVALLFGGLAPRPPEPAFDAAEVTVMSEAEFAALTRPEAAMPAAPPRRSAPAPAAEESAPADRPLPEEPRTAEPDPQPQPAPPPKPDPAPPAAPDLPRAEEDVPDPAPRVAPDPAPEPPLRAEPAPETRQAAEPEPAPELPRIAEVEPSSAPEEAAPEIVTEAEEPATRAAPDVTGRPRTRPDRPVLARRAPEPDPEPQPQPAPDPAPSTAGRTETASSAAIEDAVRDTLAALEEGPEAGDRQGAPAGPPLNRGEKSAFRLQVQRCWNVDVGSERADVTVTIRFGLNRDGTVVAGSLQQVAATGGSPVAQRTAYETGRRAILRCEAEAGGYDLPAEKYEHWDEVELTFNPREMRIR